MKKITVEKIAEQLKLSKATVSRSLRGSPLISFETKERVLACAREIGYRLDENRNVAIIVDRHIFEYHSHLLEHLVLHIIRGGYSPVIIPNTNLELLNQFPLIGVFSLLILSGLESIWGRNQCCPLVCVNTPPQHQDMIFSVCSDEAGGMTFLLDKLYHAGHRRILLAGPVWALVPKNRKWCSEIRFQTFQKWMKEHDLPGDILFEISADEPLAKQVSGIRKLIRANKVTAVLIPTEAHSYNMKRILERARFRIPEDVSLLTWEDPLFFHFFGREFSHIEQNYPELAKKAFEMLQKLIRGEKGEHDVFVDYCYFRGRTMKRICPDNK